MKIQSSIFTASLVLFAQSAYAIEPISDKNVVDTTYTCNEDNECTVEGLSYITGDGKPSSQNEVCCATFPREVWNPESKKMEKEKSKLCYSKKILENKSSFNYYKQAYCDGALSGVIALSAFMLASVVSIMSF